MPRGGKRSGTPGQTYQNRADLNAHQPVRTVPGQTYGVAGQQQQAQQAIPLPQQPAPGQMAAPAGMPMAQPPPLDAPTSRPGEPLTAGLASGPGPGPQVLAPPNPMVKAAAALNAIPNPDADTKALLNLINATVANQNAA